MNFVCPFHNDNNASLSYKKNTFFCYGCKAHSKSNFVLKLKKFDLIFNKEIILNAKKNLYLKKNYWLKYLFVRKITMFNSLKFNLGKIDFSYKKKINNILLNRLIFPICNENNILLGIGVKTNNKKNKYLNFFKEKVDEIFFGINYINNYNFVLIVEGYFDFLTIKKNFFNNVLSIFGCDINCNKIFFLLKKFKIIYFCFDGDIAGFNACEKLSKICKKLKNRIRFITLPYNYDPDKYINTFGMYSFLKFLNK